VAARKRGSYAKGIKRRNQVLDQALVVFKKRGRTTMSFSAIAEELGVSHAAVLHYFKSLDELLVEVLRRADEQALAFVSERGAQTIREQLAFGAERNVEAEGLMALYSSMLSAAIEPGNDVSREFFTERFARGRRELADSIEKGRREGKVPPGPDAHLIAALILAAFDGLQFQRLLDPSLDLAGTLDLLAPYIGDAEALESPGAATG